MDKQRVKYEERRRDESHAPIEEPRSNTERW